MNFNELVKDLRKFKNAGPKPHEDIYLTQLVQKFYNDYYPEKEDFFMNLVPNLPGTLIHHMLTQPRNYAGDFEIIERFYTFKYCLDGFNWDRYTLFHAGGQAIRNRVKVFKEILERHMNARRHSRILDLGCGAGYPIYQFFCEYPYTEAIQYTGIDQDSEAIDLAKYRTAPWNGSIRFIRNNVISLRPPNSWNKNFDVIWSGGLFDYVSDRLFERLLKKYFAYVAPKGFLIIGNFHPNNPSKAYMDMLNWKLLYRTEDELKTLVKNSGINAKKIHVFSEDEGVNLFIECQK